MTIRDAIPTDWPRMRECFVAAGRAAWTHIVSTEFLDSLQPPDRWRETISSSNPKDSVLVVESDGAVEGFCVLRPSADDDAGSGTGEVDSFYTDPRSWGRGAGRALLEAGVARLRDAGFTEATLWTAELNHRPRRIYEKAGWVADGAHRKRTMRGSTFVEVRYRIRV